MKNEINNYDGSKTRTFNNPAAALRFAQNMTNLGFKTRFAANYLDLFNEWWYPVKYWREFPEEETFQDSADAAYCDLRIAGGYRNI